MIKKGKHIPIRCKGNRYVKYDQLNAFQGGLKELTTDRAEKLMQQIKELGWIAPVIVWGDNNLLDGHQRLLVIPRLLAQGYTIDKIPVVDVDSNCKAEAAKILLAINSRYGEITDEGLYEFMHDMDLESIDLDGIELPDINVGNFISGYYDDDALDDKIDTKDAEDKELISCPKCGVKFSL